MTLSHTHRWLFALAVILALLALLVDSSEHGEGNWHGRTDAVTLAGWLRDRRPGLLIVDIRPPEAWEAYHLPAAKQLALNELRSWADSVWRGDGEAVIVIYGAGDGQAMAARESLAYTGRTEVYYLMDGVSEWLEDVMSPRLDTTASPELVAQYERIAELSRYFGGTARLGGPENNNAPATPIRPPRGGCGF